MSKKGPPKFDDPFDCQLSVLGFDLKLLDLKFLKTQLMAKVGSSCQKLMIYKANFGLRPNLPWLHLNRLRNKIHIRVFLAMHLECTQKWIHHQSKQWRQHRKQPLR